MFNQKINEGFKKLSPTASSIFSRTLLNLKKKKIVKKSSNRKSKQVWTSEEDERLKKAVQIFGFKAWKKVSKYLGNRNNKQCRQRWKFYLNPNIRKENFNESEDMVLLLGHILVGNKWTLVQLLFDRRTDQQIKNYFNRAFKKKRALLTKFVQKLVECELPAFKKFNLNYGFIFQNLFSYILEYPGYIVRYVKDYLNIDLRPVELVQKKMIIRHSLRQIQNPELFEKFNNFFVLWKKKCSVKVSVNPFEFVDEKENHSSESSKVQSPVNEQEIRE